MSGANPRRTVLASGLTVLSEQVPGRPSVSVGVWLRNGARDEPARHLGISHFLEHMMFKGTATRDARAIARSLESRGGHLDAFTTREQVCYYARTLAADLPAAVEILSDIVCHSRFAASDVERERQVVQEEILAYEDNSEERVVDVLGLESGALLLRPTRQAAFAPYHTTARVPARPDARRATSELAEEIAVVFGDGGRDGRQAEGSNHGGHNGERAHPLRLDGTGDAASIAALDGLATEDRRRIAEDRLALAVPLWGREHLLGVLLLGSPRAAGEPIAQEDIDLLETLGEQAAIAVENALLHRSEIERERMAQELRVARGIQAHLVPNSEPASDTVEFAGTTVASHEIGGDFYDYVPLSEHRIGIAIGDVAGKGVPAALLMAGMQSMFRNEAERGRSPAQVLATLNHRIHAVGERDRFVCFFYGQLDLANRQLIYANAGLDPPILIRSSGRVERLRVGGPVLGVMPGAAFQEAKVSLAAGDTLVLYTDGVVEPAEVRSGFGETDLIDFLVAHREEAPARLRELTLARLIELAGDMSLDDTTLIVARAR